MIEGNFKKPGEEEVTPTPTGTTSTRHLVRRFGRNVVALTGKELELAKSEVSDKVEQAQRGAISMVVGGAFLASGIGLVFATIVLALATQMQAWLACLIVAVAALVIAGIVMAVARSQMKNLKPDATIGSMRALKEDYETRKHG